MVYPVLFKTYHRSNNLSQRYRMTMSIDIDILSRIYFYCRLNLHAHYSSLSAYRGLLISCNGLHAVRGGSSPAWRLFSLLSRLHRRRRRRRRLRLGPWNRGVSKFTTTNKRPEIPAGCQNPLTDRVPIILQKTSASSSRTPIHSFVLFHGHNRDRSLFECLRIPLHSHLYLARDATVKVT